MLLRKKKHNCTYTYSVCFRLLQIIYKKNMKNISKKTSSASDRIEEKITRCRLRTRVLAGRTSGSTCKLNGQRSVWSRWPQTRSPNICDELRFCGSTDRTGHVWTKPVTCSTWETEAGRCGSTWTRTVRRITFRLKWSAINLG